MYVAVKAEKTNRGVSLIPIDVLGRDVPLGEGVKLPPETIIDIFSTVPISASAEKGKIIVFASDCKMSNGTCYLTGDVIPILAGDTPIFPGGKYDEYIVAYRDGNYHFKETITVQEAKEKEKVVRRKATEMDKLMSKGYLVPPTPEKEGFYVDSGLWWFLVWSYFNQNNVLLVGQSGCGKTTLPQLLMDKINKRNKRLGFDEHLYNKYDLTTINPEGEFKGVMSVIDGGTFFRYSRFAINIQKKGLSLLNELNRGSKHTQNIFMSVLDDTRTLHIEKGDTIQNIIVHPEHSFFATANIGFKFTSTQAVDVALMRRFDTVEVEKPTDEMRVEVLRKRTGITKRDAQKILRVTNEVNALNLSKEIPLPDEIKIAQKVKAGFEFIKAIEYTILGAFSNEGASGGERAVVKATLQKL